MIIIKYDSFVTCLNALEQADFNKACRDEIYRMGVLCKFNQTFELACKALQEVLRFGNVDGAEIATPREIIKLGCDNGYIADADSWQLMIEKRSQDIYFCDDEVKKEFVVMIKDCFVSKFKKLAEILEKKLFLTNSDSDSEFVRGHRY
ncbi:HI0074 family nucleotidyltransferase substrate-binding subunit [Butyrivibrio sp. M55]|uniref:HI0074 family nucleotidyltransferase substrate-binding subunit n=1 Tax=Butyrivibrio sp. M55 TaxID=1855323 RepID=UPI0008E0D049|nr:HI0074 family nucleotidyltransferase substrate-binding subunit [Butyrivibrio sp. M55]SFU93699.1 nucleotidyltransferase substrate binding protein, HI0074 family [Butyrivibrio sp. M55]